VIRSAGLVALGAVVAGAAFVAWQQFFSRDAQIRAIHAACVKEFAQTGAKARSGVEAGTPGFARSAGESVAKWLDGAAAGMGETVCGTVRDACVGDFDGRVCVAVRERYR
jgi:hypothetical protein